MMTSTEASFSKEEFKKKVVSNCKSLYRKNIDEADKQQVFQSVAYAVKDLIIDKWIATHKTYDEEDPKYIKADWKLNEYFTAIIADELNVKEVEYTDDVRAFTSYSFKPQLKTLGPKYGKHLNAIRAALSTLDGNATMDELNAKGSFTINADGEDIVLEKDDVLIEMTQKEGFVASSDKGITVVMDTNLTPELIEEGFVREIVSKIQTMRKDAGFEVMDKITVYVDGNDKLADLMKKNEEQIKSVVLANSIETGKTAGFSKDWDINGEKVVLAVEKN